MVYENGTEKELEQQRNRYASNPEVREKKSQYYEEDKKKQAALLKEKEKQWRKNDGKKSVSSSEDLLRYKNDQKYKTFKWICEFLEHFLETFKEVCKETEEKLYGLIRQIEEHYAKNVSEIDEMTENANEAADQYDGEYPHFRDEKFFQKDGLHVRKIHEN